MDNKMSLAASYIKCTVMFDPRLRRHKHTPDRMLKCSQKKNWVFSIDTAKNKKRGEERRREKRKRKPTLTLPSPLLSL